MKILILGGSGFIGGAIARRLLDRGDDVRLLMRTHSQWSGMAEGDVSPEIFEGSLGDPQSIATAAEGVDVIVHAAGLISPRASARALRWTHVAGTENVLNAAVHAGVRRLVHISCADVTLSNQDRVHWDEERGLSGLPFGERARTLALAEELSLSASGPKLETICLRPTWVWGPGDLSRLPQLCKEGLRGGIEMASKGENLLAITYIDNLVDAVLSALTCSEAVGQRLYIADSEFLEAREFFAALSTALGLAPPRSGSFGIGWNLARLRGPKSAKLTQEEMLQRGRSALFDVNRAIACLNYRPAIGLEEGLEALKTWATSEGGPSAIAKAGRAAASDADVDAQVSAAGGD